MNLAVGVGRRAERSTLSALETLTVGILAGMILIWLSFQVVDLQALFPPIGILYALGSIIVAGTIMLGRWQRSPALAAGWGLLMMIPESVPAIGHLLDWNDLYTHFAHYLIIMTFFPLAILLVAAGIGATIQNARREPGDRRAPRWLRGALLGVGTLILVSNAVTVLLYAFRIP